MKGSDNLYQLIHSLTKAEKRYFKLNASIQSGDKSYLILFDALDKQKVYEEEKLLKSLKGQKFLNHLPVIKNYLYNLILKTLRSYKADDSVEKSVKGAILDIKLLHAKGLAQQSMKLLEKTLKTARKYELHAQLIELLDLQNQMIQDSWDMVKLEKTVDGLFSEANTTLKALENLFEIKRIESTFRSIYKQQLRARNPEETAHYKKLEEHPLFKEGETAALSFEAKALLLLTKIVYLDITGFQDESYALNTRVLEIMDASPHMALEIPARYVSAFRNEILFTNGYKEDERTHELIHRLRNLPIKEPVRKSGAELMSYMLELYYYVVRGLFEDAMKIIPNIKVHLEKNSEHLYKEDELVINFLCFQSCFGSENYSDATDWLNKILDDKSNARQDIRSISKVLFIILHYEMQNYELLTYAIKWVYRYLKNRDRLYEFETNFLRFITKAGKVRSKEELTEQFKQLKGNLVELQEDRYENQALLYFDFLSWVESKVQKRSFASVVQERAQHASWQDNPI